jgi:adenosylhomocysteine nucleosidase
MRILFVAAEAMEFEGILAHARDVAAAPVDAGWARRCRLGGHDALLVANGAGWKRAETAARAGIDDFHPDAVVSTGFCGALDPRFGVADVVVANEIFVSGRPGEPIPVCVVRDRRADGPICSIDHIARTAGEKARLRKNGAVAVEMEAAGVAECAAARGLPFYCVRAVTDLAGETLANDFQKALREDGHFDTILIFTDALRQPVARIPELLRLRQRCRRAARTLGDFFTVCGF